MPDGSTAIPERPRPEAAQSDPFRDLVARLNRDALTLAAKDPDLSRSIGQLAQAVSKPGQAEDQTIRTRVAYALQDIEKLAGPISTVPPALREEMTRLAATAPGLQNERLQELVKQTPAIGDKRLVADIRDLALTTGRQGEQHGPEVREKIEALENRVRLNPGPSPSPADGNKDRPSAARAPIDGAQATQPRPSEAPQPQRSPASSEHNPAATPDWQAPKAQSEARPTQQQPSNPENVQNTARGPGALSLALAALASRRYDNASENTPERPPSPIADRSARHEHQFQGQRDDATVAATEKSQAAALGAIRDYANGPGSNILTKIQDAARNDPGGMAAVLSEMREGGRFAGLRTQLNADLATERGAAAAYDRMTGALAQYGNDRAAVDAIGARTNTAAALTAKFQKVDAEIGNAVSMLPSKADGKSLIDDLGDKLKQVLDRAVEAVRSVFTPSAERAARVSASPSPSP